MKIKGIEKNRLWGKWDIESFENFSYVKIKQEDILVADKNLKNEDIEVLQMEKISYLAGSGLASMYVLEIKRIWPHIGKAKLCLSSKYTIFPKVQVLIP